MFQTCLWVSLWAHRAQITVVSATPGHGGPWCNNTAGWASHGSKAVSSLLQSLHEFPLPPGSCLEFLPRLPSLIECDVEVKRKLPFLPQTAFGYGIFCHNNRRTKTRQRCREERPIGCHHELSTLVKCKTTTCNQQDLWVICTRQVVCYWHSSRRKSWNLELNEWRH